MHPLVYGLIGLMLAYPFAEVAKAQGEAARPSSAVQSLNPDTSINFLTLYKQSKRKGSDRTEPDGGFSLQEAELQFTANVDPYLRASILLSVHPAEEDATAGTASSGPAEPEEKSWAIEPEEVFLETIALPYVTIKAGRFHTALGRHNGLHAHAFPFIDAPLIHQNLLGEEGLTENGLSASALVPVPWFLEATVQAVQGDSPALFASQSASDGATVYRLRNLFELSDASTLDFGFSAAAGQNFYDSRSTVEGVDLTYKWRPISGGKYTALILAGEYLQGAIKGREEGAKQRGQAAWIQYQFAERWWIQARSEEADAPHQDSERLRKNSALLAFYPSEFSGVRLQLDRTTGGGEKALDTVMLQGNLSIGAHPAHTY